MRRFDVSALLLCVATTGCGNPAPDKAAPGPPERSAKADSHGHVHVAPHGGALVLVGEHFAHLEVVLDPSTGEIALFVLDSGAERGVPIETPGLRLELDENVGDGAAEAVARGASATIELSAVTNALTGETLGNSSEFRGTSPALRGVTGFEGRIPEITIRGQVFRNVVVRWPEGNE